MADYTDIYGKRVKEFATDPTLTSSYEGQVWYNANTETLKSVVSFDAWASGSPLITARYSTSGAGTQTASLHIGGNVGPGDTRTALVEEYNGSGFSAGGALPTATRSGGGAGTQTAAFYAGGYATADVSSAYTYNGSSWTSIPSLGTARRSLNPASAGTTTASIVCGGYASASPEGARAIVEEYNGSSWSEQNDLPAARANVAACGTQTALIIANGGPSAVNLSFLYDGTNWTAAPNTNATLTGRMGAGTQTAAIVAGGRPPTSNVTENYDGTSWTTNPATLGTARYEGAPATSGTSSEWMISGGYSTAISAATEEFNKSINTITAAAWAAGGSISTVRTNVGSTSEGSQTAAMVWGGRTGPPPSGPYTSNKSDTYDGSSFSTAPNLNTASRTRSGGGTVSAAWCAGGTSPTYINSTEEYNGSSWTSVTNAPLVFFASGTGAQTAGLIAGINSDVNNPGGSDAYPGISLEYDGTNWATGGNPSSDRTSAGCSGTQTAGTLISGQNVPGNSPGGSLVTTIEEYNGSSWTSGGASVIAAKDNNAACRGTQTATLITGGNINPPAAGITSCSIYDGTSTATTASMGTGRRGHGSDGGPSSGLVMTGQSAGPPANNNPNYTANAEEFTAETSAIASKTLTTS
tara:strand:- start:36 stop:1949 length:1914 start_codon:yes stop_codon:yes gene_type:complete